MKNRTPKHGTATEYSRHKCRCDACRKAGVAYTSKYVDPIKRRAAIKNHQKRRRDFIRDAKSKPCMDCEKSYPYYVMQFDHVTGDKKFNICRQRVDVGMAGLLEEMSKCEVVCANCHFIRSQRRKCPEQFIAVTPENYNLQFGRYSQELPIAA